MSDVTIQPPATGRNYWLTAVWLTVFAMLALIAWGLINNSQTRPLPGSAAPNFQLTYFEGYGWAEQPAGLQLADLHGRVVVINFWASWCVECHYEALALEEIWRAYRGQDVVFLGVAYVDTQPQSLGYLAQYGISYPNGPDLQGRISKAYEITGVPETFVIGPDGAVHDVQIGPINEARLRASLDELLAGSN